MSSEINDLPPIAPTGAMSSGDYVSYMMGYDSQAEDVELENVTNFQSASTMDEWYALWVRVLGEVTKRLSSVEKSITTLSQQIRVIDTKLKSM